MATEADCDKALRSLVDMLARVPADVRSKYVLERTVSCRVHDLDITWSARLCDEGIIGLTTGEDAKAQVRISVGSDDLLALVEGRQSLPSAFATGKVRVQASPLDMLRLTALI
ncbi:MAG: sterol-binding protein [Frankiales bacterium]|nr:sterol-binding protein [Frankiales bacterium]